MTRLAGPVQLLVLALVCGASCQSRRKPTPGVASVGSANGAATSPIPVSSDAVFSAPIGAARVGRGSVIAGLVASEGIIRVVGLREGQAPWTVDALTGVAWTPDAELRLQAADDGVALVWRGMLSGRSVAVTVLLGPRGQRRREPFEVGSAFCMTSDGIAWIDVRPAHPARVQARRWADSVAHDIGNVPSDRTPSLVCGDHDVFVLEDGDDDLTSLAFVPGETSPQPVIKAIRDEDFGDDEERAHETYTMSDDLGIVRIGGSGAVALREISHAGGLAPWRRLKHRLSAEDDVVAADGDALGTLVVFAHEGGDLCGELESTAERLQALRVDRKTGDESLIDLAPASCGADKGPLWIASAPGAPVIAWVVRGRAAPSDPPVSGIELRAIRAEGVRARRIDVHADVVVDGGCDDTGCIAAALVRGPDGDGMRPGRIVVLSYP